MLTLGFITTPLPICAPKAFSINTFKPEKTFHEAFKKKILKTYQVRLFNLEPGWYQLLLYEDKSVFKK